MPDTTIVLLGLIAIVAVNTGLKIWAESNARKNARKISMVLDVLIVWADTWGHGPDEVKAELKKALHGRRHTDTLRRPSAAP